LDSHPIPFSILAIVLCVHANKLYRWYKHVLSEYPRQQAAGELHKHDLIGSAKPVAVPIMEPKHIGLEMAIDEKHMDGEFYTVLTNKTTGKVAMLAQTVRRSEIDQVLAPYLHQRYQVRVLTRDLANTYDWVGRTCFPNAMQVADKFHIISQALDQLQAHRVGFRQELLTQRRQLWQQHKKQNKHQPFTFEEERLDNGETQLELLARSRYLLYKFPSQWSDSQKTRAKVLFEHYPSIKTAYGLICNFRRWYRKDFVGTSLDTITHNLENWYEKVEKADIMEINAFKSLVERHQGVIINYFEKGHTNALAEATNKKLNTFIRNNQGINDKDFFFFRIKKYFS
jgi:transposase